MIVINIATPDTMEGYKQLFDYVDPRLDDIVVSRAYYLVHQSYNEGFLSIRHGFKFMFWLNDPDLAEEFRRKFDGEYVEVEI